MIAILIDGITFGTIAFVITYLFWRYKDDLNKALEESHLKHEAREAAIARIKSEQQALEERYYQEELNKLKK